MLLKIIIVSSFVMNVLSFQPEFAEPIVNISVAVGRDAVFTCHVRHLGGYRVGWVKADTKAIQAIHEHVITHNPRVTVSHADQNTWNLHMKAVTEDDRGGYMCQLNTDPMKSQIGYLDVVIPPDFIAEDTSSDLFMAEGSSVKLTCRARGYPHPNVTWRREDGAEIVLKDAQGTKQMVMSFGGEVLKLTKLSRSEMGSYLCIASNGVPPSVSKRISLSIHFHPVINVRNQLVGSPLDKDVTIECSVEASPKSINYWIRDTGEMIVSSGKFVVQEVALSLYETHMSVTVKRFAKEDIGSYRCIAKNSQGEVDSSIRLYEIPDAKSTPNKPTTTHHQPQHPNAANDVHSNKGHHKRPRVTYRPTGDADDDGGVGGGGDDDNDPDADGDSIEDYGDFADVTLPPMRRGPDTSAGIHHGTGGRPNNGKHQNNAGGTGGSAFGGKESRKSYGGTPEVHRVNNLDNSEVSTAVSTAKAPRAFGGCARATLALWTLLALMAWMDVAIVRC